MKTSKITTVMAALLCTGLLLFAFLRWCPCPDYLSAPLPASLAIRDSAGGIMRVVLAGDDSDCRPVPQIDGRSWIALATIAAEDQRFLFHYGMDPLAVLRAVRQNLTGRRVISGASTLTALVVRLSRPARNRTVLTKVNEFFRAVQLDMRNDKETILTAYLNRAPFGGNLVGIEAASQNYCGKRWQDLSLAEAALLAGLPQAPSRLRPDRHPERAFKRRQYVLERMLASGMITELQLAEAVSAPLPQGRLPLPFESPHAALTVLRQAERQPELIKNNSLVTTINPNLQAAVESALREQIVFLGDTRVCGGAVLVMRVEDGAVLAMAGSPDFNNNQAAGQVNAAFAKRSPGSALKPFLYAAAFDSGMITAKTIIDDQARAFGSTVPENFDGKWRNRVTAEEALSHSLNMPAYILAAELGAERFLNNLRSLGFATLGEDSTHYGLALALGGCEVRLWDLVGAYGCLASGGRKVIPRLAARDNFAGGERVFSEAACWLTNGILADNLRHQQAGSTRFAWKTGTSSGFRDAWCVAWNNEIVAGVWLGNPDGRGNAALTGAEAALPLARKVIVQAIGSSLASPFPLPEGELELFSVCAASGREAGSQCKTLLEDWRIKGTTRRRPCKCCQEAVGITAGSLADLQPPRIVFPHRDSVIRRSEMLGIPTVIPLQSAGNGTQSVFWFANGEPLREAQPGETVLWNPGKTSGRVRVTCSTGTSLSDEISFLIE